MTFMPTKLNLKGKTFGSLIVMEECGRDKWGAVLWRCECVCGKTTLVRGQFLVKGKIGSCGCGIGTRDKPRTHGQTKTRIYRCWQAMKARCTNKKFEDFHNYGGRGITVCERWSNSFELFFEDMGKGFFEDAEIDRKDTNGNYEPGNCQWITHKDQQRNKRNNHMLTIGDRTMTLVEWGEETGIKPNTILARIRRGWPNHRLLEIANE